MAVNPELVRAVANIKRKGLVSPATGEKDSVLVQMNPREAQALPHLLNTPPVVNPHTGLLSFPPAGGQAAHDHAAASGAGGNKSGGSNGGSAGGGFRGGFSDARHDAGLDSPGHYGGNAGGGYNGTGRGLPGGQLTIGGPARNYGDPYGANSPTGQALATHGLDPQHVGAALQSQHDYVNASKAYADRSGFQKALDALAGMIPGISTQKPNLNSPATYVGGTYHHDLNPAGAVGGILGAASGMLGASTIGEYGLGGVYNALGGKNYSLGGQGVDPQTGEKTSGWVGGGLGFGGLGGGTPGTQGPHNGPDQGQTLAGTLAGVSKAPSVGTNAGTPAKDPSVAAVYAPPPTNPFVGTASAMNTYNGTPWPTYPGDIWIGGGRGSRAIG